MAWTIFELVINLFQSSLILFYLKHCFSYEKKVLLADTSFLAIFTAFLTLSARRRFNAFFRSADYFFLVGFLPALISFHPSLNFPSSIEFILSLVFNLVSVLTYPVFDLFPLILGDYISKLCVQKGFLYHRNERSSFLCSQADYPD